MEIDIVGTLHEKLKERFNDLFSKLESKFNNDINDLEILKYSFYDVDKEGK